MVFVDDEVLKWWDGTFFLEGVDCAAVLDRLEERG